MKKLFLLYVNKYGMNICVSLLCICLHFQIAFGISTDVLITNIRDTSVICDYLIIAPVDFLTSAIRLAEHRNTSMKDDVHNARVLLLSRIYSEFPISDKTKKHESIWYGLQWGYYNWHQPMKYVLFLGDDQCAFQATDSIFYSVGNVPTYYEDEFNLAPMFSDDWYTSLQCDTPPYTKKSLYGVPIALGRIPCETVVQCSMYVNKLIQFDLHSPKGLWRNRVMISTDDNFLGPTTPDPIVHFTFAENISKNHLNDYFVTKCYLPSFQKSSSGEHLNGKRFFFNEVNNGVLWNVFFGHGNHSALTGENFVNITDTESFQNSSQPIIFFAYGCKSAGYNFKYDSTMCKQFLLLPKGGAIAYIGVTRIGFADPNLHFMKTFFSFYCSNPTLSIGRVIYAAKSAHSYYDHFILLGDPALTVTQHTIPLTLTLLPDSTSAQYIRCSVTSNTPFKGTCKYTASQFYEAPLNNNNKKDKYIKDSILYTEEIPFSETCDIPIIQFNTMNNIRFICYVYNDSTEGRAHTFFNTISTPIQKGKVSKDKTFTMSLKNHSIHLHKKYGLNESSCSIYNLKGQIVYHKKILSSTTLTSINLKQFSPGYYIASLTDGTSRYIYPFFYDH